MKHTVYLQGGGERKVAAQKKKYSAQIKAAAPQITDLLVRWDSCVALNTWTLLNLIVERDKILITLSGRPLVNGMLENVDIYVTHHETDGRYCNIKRLG